MEATLPKKVGSQTRLDTVGAIAHRWCEIRPDLDPSPLLVIGRISRIESLVDARLRPPFAAAGLTSGDFDLLAALRRQGPPHESTPGELATNMLVTTGGITKRIDRLEAQGFCTRRTSPLDQRKTPAWHCCQAGVFQFIAAAIANYAAALPGGISGFSPRMISLVMTNF